MTNTTYIILMTIFRLNTGEPDDFNCFRMEPLGITDADFYVCM